MNENIDINKLNQIKDLLREKEKISYDSQVKQNKIEMQLTKLETIKNNIINPKKKILPKIISFIVYDIVILSIIFSFINSIVNKFILTPLLITILYIGVLLISITGAYIASNLEKKIKKYYYKKKLNIISNKIKKKEEEKKLEIEKQKIIKKEITQKINSLDKQLPEIQTLDNNYKTNIKYTKNTKKIKIKCKIKNNKNH